MSKTITPGSQTGTNVTHDSDGKNSPLSSGSGNPIVTSGSVLLGTAKSNGQVKGTNVVFNNPA